MAKTPVEFYEELGPHRLAQRKNPVETAGEVSYLNKFFGSPIKILDVGCGYGRLTIPFVDLGYNMAGIDIAPSYIAEAKRTVEEKGLAVDFRLGDMTSLPYEDGSFDGIMCMWGAFVELIKREEQIKTIREMHRVLRKGGKSLIDMPVEKKEVFVKTGEKGDEITIDLNTRLVRGRISGLEIAPLYNHSPATLSSLMIENDLKNFRVYEDEMAGKRRQFLMFRKT